MLTNKRIYQIIRESINHVINGDNPQKKDVYYYKNLLSSCTWHDIDFEEGEFTPDNCERLIVIAKGEPIPTEFINLQAQWTRLEKIQLHTIMVPELRRMGNGTKIYNAFIHLYGGIYSGFGRVHNPEGIFPIYRKLSMEPDVKVQYVLGVDNKPIGIEAFLAN